MNAPRRVVVVDNEPALSVGGSFFRGFCELGDEAHFFDTGRFMGGYKGGKLVRAARRLARPATQLAMNLALVTMIRRMNPDLVLVVKGWDLLAGAVDAMKAPGRAVVVYHPDDLENPLNTNAQMREAIPKWDAIFTPRRFAVDELRARGARHVELMFFGYDPAVHHPAKGSERVEPGLAGKATFVGAWAPEREELLAALATRVPLTVYGTSWDRVRRGSPLVPHLHPRTVMGEDLNAFFHEAGANLSLLRKANRDLHQMRTFEVPACAGLLLAERTVDHQELFEEGREALFFDGIEECVAQVERVLASPETGRRIAEAGYRRLVAGGHTYRDRAARIRAVVGGRG